MTDAFVIFSGGPDSTAAAMWAIQSGYNVSLLTFKYKDSGQEGELAASTAVATDLGREQFILDITQLMASFDPNAHIMMHAGTRSGDATSKAGHTLPFGVGMVFSMAANFAIYRGVHCLVWGATKDDGTDGEYQYTANFATDYADSISRATGTSFSIETPFAVAHKFEVLNHYFKGREPLFAKTWSCKRGGSVQSGDCAASIARRAAAVLAGINDLTTYANPVALPPINKNMTEEELSRIMKSPRMPTV